LLLFLLALRPPSPTLSPYTTLFRSLPFQTGQVIPLHASRPPAALSDAPARQGPPQAQARRAKRLFLPCAPRQLLVQWEPPKTSMPSTFRQFCSSGLCGQVWGSPVDGLWITAGRWITDFHNPHSGTKGVIVPAARGLPVSDRGENSRAAQARSGEKPFLAGLFLARRAVEKPRSQDAHGRVL